MIATLTRLWIVAQAEDKPIKDLSPKLQELKAQVGELSLQLAGRMVGESLDRDRHLRLVDDYIRDLEHMPPSNGNGHGGASDASSSPEPKE